MTIAHSSCHFRAFCLNQVASLQILSDLGMKPKEIAASTFIPPTVGTKYSWGHSGTMVHCPVHLCKTAINFRALPLSFASLLSWNNSLGFLLSDCVLGSFLCISLSTRTFCHMYLHSPYAHLRLLRYHILTTSLSGTEKSWSFGIHSAMILKAGQKSLLQWYSNYIVNIFLKIMGRSVEYETTPEDWEIFIVS